MDFFVQLGDNKFKFIYPGVSKLDVLDQDPVTGLGRLRDRVFNRFVETFADLEVMQL